LIEIGKKKVSLRGTRICMYLKTNNEQILITRRPGELFDGVCTTFESLCDNEEGGIAAKKRNVAKTRGVPQKSVPRNHTP